MTAAELLARALQAAADRGSLPPCAGRDEWISDDREEREWAGWHCAHCPVLDACRDAADEQREGFGVWAGRDYSNRRAAA